MVSLNHSTLIARYERLRKQLATLDQQLLIRMRTEPAGDHTPKSLVKLLEQIESIDCQLVELERLLPEKYEYKPGDE